MSVTIDGTAGLTFPNTTVQATAAVPASVVVSNRTSNTILGAADNSTLINITSGTFSQTFTAAATLGSGWFCYIKNAGTGDITLDPNGSETIDGLTSYIMYTGEVRLVQCNGTGFTSLVLSPFYRAFTTSGTFTTPPGYSIFSALVWSGGASGAKDNVACRGGFGGGCFPFQLLASTFGATETITIGAGGTSTTTLGGGSNAGGNTTIGSLARVTGAASSLGGAVGTSGQFTTTTDGGGNYKNGMGFEAASSAPAASVSTIWGGAGNATNGSVTGGSAIYGGASGGGHDGTTLRAGGTSIYGGNGGTASVTTDGTAGSAPAGGGGACKSTGNSGAGGRGEVRIWGVA